MNKEEKLKVFMNKPEPSGTDGIVTCPGGHKDTWLVKDMEIIKKHGYLLGCDVCEDFYEIGFTSEGMALKNK